MLAATLPAKTDVYDPAGDAMTAIDQWELMEFSDRVIADLAAGAHTATVVVGVRLGLYRTMADAGPATPAELAAAASCDERYMIEWLAAQAAAGYCEYDPDTGRFSLSDAQEACLADESGAAYLASGTMLVSAMVYGDPWADHHLREAQQVIRWIATLDGVAQRLADGARVADVCCRHGASTIALARAYPRSTFVGFDPHQPSVDTARKAAVEAGVGDRVSFEVAGAQDFPGAGFDLVCMLDALHDLGDPVGAAAHIRAALAPSGTWLLVEPMAGETLEDNLNDVGRLYYSMSTLVCIPTARAKPGGWALGAQASEAQLHGVCRRAGLTHFRRATETQLHRVFEVRP
jgi:SAM-dependent methyltransferase